MKRRSLVRVRRGAQRRARGGAPSARVVSDAWSQWVVDNLLRGVEPLELVQGLVDGGVPGTLAHGTVATILHSPALAVAKQRDRWSQRLALVARLGGSVRCPPSTIERREAPPAAKFFARYWETSTPAVFTDVVPRWRARWTPESLRQRFGEVVIEACTGRDTDPRPDANWRQHRVELPLAEYVDRMLAVDRSNDLYLIANNRNTARPELRSLWDDVVLPSGWFREPQLPFGSALWLGPPGTETPLHHDTSNILFCQVHGRKRVLLAPPWSTELLATTRGVYNERSAAEVVAEGIDAIELVLEPGEALFIPVGWWHDVLALDASVSLAINAFARANGYGWYKPGSVR